MTSRIPTRLYCLHCAKETEHIISYAGDLLKSLRCQECGMEITLDRKQLLEEYATESIKRILTKPHRLTEEMRQDLAAFLASLPIRILTKPYRIAREIMDVLKEGEEE